MATHEAGPINGALDEAGPDELGLVKVGRGELGCIVVACGRRLVWARCSWRRCSAWRVSMRRGARRRRRDSSVGRPLSGSDAAMAPVRVSQPPLPPAVFQDAESRRSRVDGALPAIDAKLQSAADKMQLPTLAVGIVLDGELVFAKGYGAGVDDSTVFRIGSITKVITGMALLKLRDAGKVSLSAAAAQYLPELAKLVYPTSDTAPITVLQLITHDAGLPRNGPIDVTSPTPPSEAVMLKALDGLRLKAEPGRGPKYSNLGVSLLGPVIGRASGMPYRDYVSKHLLAPLKMTATVWDASDVPAGKLAQAHGDDGQPIAPKDHWRRGAAEADGGLYSNVRDMSRLIAAQLGAWPARNDRDTGPVKRASLRESQRMRVFERIRGRFTDEGSPSLRASASGTGIAWQVKQTCKHDHLVWHNGGTEGYKASLFMLPQRGVGIVALSGSKKGLDAIAMGALGDLVEDANLAARTPQPSEQLKEAMSKVASLLERGNINGPDYLTLFDAEFRQSISLQKLRQLTKDLRARHQVCRFDDFVHVDMPHLGRARFPCDAGTELEVTVLLSHATPQQIRLLTIKAPQPPKPPRPRCD